MKPIEKLEIKSRKNLKPPKAYIPQEMTKMRSKPRERVTKSKRSSSKRASTQFVHQLVEEERERESAKPQDDTDFILPSAEDRLGTSSLASFLHEKSWDELPPF
jgi:hypothetical protein